MLFHHAFEDYISKDFRMVEKLDNVLPLNQHFDTYMIFNRVFKNLIIFQSAIF